MRCGAGMEQQDEPLPCGRWAGRGLPLLPGPSAAREPAEARQGVLAVADPSCREPGGAPFSLGFQQEPELQHSGLSLSTTSISST